MTTSRSPTVDPNHERAETLERRGREPAGMLPAFVGPLAPVVRFLLPLVVLAVVGYVVYRILT